jgi:hypothetical protein
MGYLMSGHGFVVQIAAWRDSLPESSVIAGGYEQLDTYEVSDPELGRVYPFTEEAGIAVDPLIGRALCSNVPKVWFDAETAWGAVPSGRRGRQQAYSNAAIQACRRLKVLFGLPLRQTTEFVESLVKLVGLDWSVPDFSTMCRRQRTLSVAISYKRPAGPLHLLIPSHRCKQRLPTSGQHRDQG